MASPTAVSLDRYLNTVYEPDCEYVDGELIERYAGELDHSALQVILTNRLYTRRKELGIHVHLSVRTQVSASRFRVPDIAVTLERGKGRILGVPPFLCIEILSPEDRASRIEEKIDDYLKFGIAHVWLIDPRKRSAWSYTQTGREAVDVLVTSQPTIELPVRDIFAELDEEIDFE